jgi:hypothetical protein
VLLILLGLAIGVIMELIVESLALRLFIVVLVAAAALWALNDDFSLTRGLTTPIREDNASSLTDIKIEEVKLENVQLSQTGYGGYALSGNVENDSKAWLTTVRLRITLKDCRDSSCRIVGQEDTSVSVSVPPQQMRAFDSVAIKFNELPTLGPRKCRFWSYAITSLKGTPIDQQQASSS